jgi:hypothetical protein
MSTLTTGATKLAVPVTEVSGRNVMVTDCACPPPMLIVCLSATHDGDAVAMLAHATLYACAVITTLPMGSSPSASDDTVPASGVTENVCETVVDPVAVTWMH